MIEAGRPTVSDAGGQGSGEYGPAMSRSHVKVREVLALLAICVGLVVLGAALRVYLIDRNVNFWLMALLSGLPMLLAVAIVLRAARR